MKYKAINANVKVNGQAILDVLNVSGSLKDITMSILAENGMVSLDSKEWYPQQKLLNVFTYLSNNPGGSETLYGVGKTVSENVKFPSNIKDVHEALSAIDIAYHINHRLDGKVLSDDKTKETEENIGNYRYKFIDEKKAEIVCDNPYPCDFDKGIIYSAAKRFKPPESVSVKIDHDKGESCRETGGSFCRYIISW